MANNNQMTNKLTIRLTNNQLLVLSELQNKLGCTLSLLIRTIVGSWITTNESIIDNLLTRDNNELNIFENDEPMD